MNNLHHDHVHTDEYTQTGATLQYYNIQLTSLEQPHSQSSKKVLFSENKMKNRLQFDKQCCAAMHFSESEPF